MSRNDIADTDRDPTDDPVATVPLRLNADGKRVTIPVRVREAFNLEAGDRFWVTVEECDR